MASHRITKKREFSGDAKIWESGFREGNQHLLVIGACNSPTTPDT